MDFRVLGPLAVVDERGPSRLQGPRVRALLAYLLLHANTPVSTTELLDELWGEDLPSSGATAVQNAVARLRRSLGDRIVTVGAAYLVRVEPGELDLYRFREIVERAGASHPEQRAVLLREALALWRGEALGSVGSAPFVARERARLEGERLAALNDRVDADLALGRHSALVSELSALVAEHPLDERFRAQLILALYRSGRQAAALDVYRETRQVLADELGLEPSPALRELERAVLQQDPALDAPRFAPADTERPARSRRVVWVVGIAALFAAGAAAAVLLVRDDHRVAAAPPSSSARQPSVQATEPPTTAVVLTHTQPAVQPARRPHRRRRVTHTVPAKTEPVSTVATAPTSTAAATTPGRPEAKKQKRVHRKVVPRTTTPRPATTTRQKPTTTTRRTTTTSATTVSTTTVAEPTGPPLVADTFDGATDLTFWSPTTIGEGTEIVQRNGRVEMTIAADAVPNGTFQQLGGGYQMRCKYPGDFDAQVDYELLEWPPANGAAISLVAAMHDRRDFPREIFPQVWRRSLPGKEQYHSYVVAGEVFVNTDDREGRLRIARRNNVFATYYWKRERWVKMDSAILPGNAEIAFTIGSGADEWAKHDVTVAFDNFVLYASRDDCP